MSLTNFEMQRWFNFQSQRRVSLIVSAERLSSKHNAVLLFFWKTNVVLHTFIQVRWKDDADDDAHGAGKELNHLLPWARNHPCLTCNTLGDAISTWFLWKSLWKIRISAATQLLILCTKESLYQAWFSFTITVLPGNFSGLKPCKFLVALFQ